MLRGLWVGKTFSIVSTTVLLKTYYDIIGPKLFLMMILERQISVSTGERLIYSRAAFLASRIVPQEKGKGKMMNAIYGRKCCEQFGRLPHHGWWVKTFSGLLVGREGWFSRRCMLTWKLKVTPYKRMYDQLQVSALHTNDIESSLLPTPTVVQSSRKTTDGKNISHTTGRRYGLSITQAALLLPTPTVSESWNIKQQRKDNNLAQGGRHGVGLKDLFYAGLLPTPAAQDSKNATLPKSQVDRGSIPGALLSTGHSGQLNVRFVMEMMGFPPDWTLLPFLREQNPEEEILLVDGETKV